MDSFISYAAFKTLRIVFIKLLDYNLWSVAPPTGQEFVFPHTKL